MVRGRAIHSPRLKDKKRRARRSIWILSLIIFLSFLYLLYRLLSASFLQITSVDVKGTSTLSPDVVALEVMQLLDHEYLGLIPYSNTILYPRSTIEHTLKKTFPILKNIEISHDGSSKLLVEVDEYTPSALWCEGEFLYHTFGETPCYYLTSEGYLYAKAQPTDDRSYVRYYGLSTTTPLMGSNLFDGARFRQFDDFVTGIIRLKLPVLGVSVGNTGDHELYVLTSIATSTEYATIYFNERMPLSKTLDNLMEFVGNKKGVLLRHGTTSLDYIDARYGTTIFSKMK
ncbi:MAG: hypothetical protein HZA80_01590 [Candidatus Taylorbacteria bacterium]|nr:hypothetical protein [Candidatus Taylorbacteria bacterium]